MGAVAGNRGIETTTAALIGLLEDAIPGSGLPAIRCAAYRAADLTAPMGEGISLYLHHVSLDTTRTRHPPADGIGRHRGGGDRAALPRDRLVAADRAPAAPARLGRLSRCSATPVLSAERLNGDDEVFAAGEQVAVTWEALSNEQLAAIWQVAPMSRQPSGSFVARFQLG